MFEIWNLNLKLWSGYAIFLEINIEYNSFELFFPNLEVNHF